MTAAALAAAARRRPAEVRGVTGGASLVTGATATSGVLTYAFLILAARTLTHDAYGLIGVLWAAMFLTAIVVFRPLEQTISQAISDRRARGVAARPVVRMALVVGCIVALAFVVALAAAWDTLRVRIFDGSDTLTLLFGIGVLAYGSSYVVRGLVGGARWFGGYATILIADGAVRLLVALPLIVSSSRTVAAVAVAAAGLGGAVAPLAVGWRRMQPDPWPAPSEAYPARRAAAFAGPAAVVAGADQLLVNGAPLLVVVFGATGSTRAAAVVFAVTMLLRAPVYVFQGFAASLLPNLTHLAASDGRRALRRGVVGTVARLGAVGGVFVLGVVAAGPLALHAIYGGSYTAGRIALGLVALGVAFYLAAGTFSQALLALRHVATAAVAWSAAAAAFVLTYAVIDAEVVLRAAIALGVGSAVAAAALGVALVARTK